jgi:hypothetical protein
MHTPIVKSRFWRSVLWDALFALPFWAAFALVLMYAVHKYHALVALTGGITK